MLAVKKESVFGVHNRLGGDNVGMEIKIETMINFNLIGLLHRHYCFLCMFYIIDMFYIL
jgi:hypothetical protein